MKWLDDHINLIDASEDFLAERIDYLPAFGIDGVPDGLAAVRHGRLIATVMQDMDSISKIIHALTMGITDFGKLSEIAGYQVDSRMIQVPNHKVTRQNVKEMFNKSRK